MAETLAFVVETEDGKTFTGPSQTLLEQLIAGLSLPGNTWLRATTDLNSAAPWDVMVALDPEVTGRYQVTVQDFVEDDHSVVDLDSAVSAAEEAFAMVAEMLESA